MRYEVERVYLTDDEGHPQQNREPSVMLEAGSAKEAALAFVRHEGARLLGSICEARGDQCTATAWNGGRLYVLTVWRLGHRPNHAAN